MMHFNKNPAWIDCRLLSATDLNSISPALFDEINDGLANFQSDAPLVSVVIPVLNEELPILRTLYSLSKNISHYPVEIIVVNNNSSDRTQEVLNKLNVKSYMQVQPGWGPARQLGQEKALGKYILMADADCFYPETWIETLTRGLMEEGVVCVIGGYSFLGTPETARWKFFIYEQLRSVISALRHFKRPWLNAMGMSMGYLKELGLKKGFVDRKIRGEDGRMCFELAQLGKIVRLRSNAVVVWTFPRILQIDGGLLHSIFKRVIIEVSRIPNYFHQQALHDTHTSLNSYPSFFKHLKKPKKLPKEIEEVK